jgi:hypothetical protein
VQHQNQCWYQNAINLARMGETAKAADFTLHAPFRTTVEGRVVAGKVVVDRVTPASRRADRNHPGRAGRVQLPAGIQVCRRGTNGNRRVA